MDNYAEKNGWKDKLLPWAYESGILDGKLYSLPLTYESMILFYNKTLFDKKGWTIPNNAAGSTRLVRAAIAVTATT